MWTKNASHRESLMDREIKYPAGGLHPGEPEITRKQINFDLARLSSGKPLALSALRLSSPLSLPLFLVKVVSVIITVIHFSSNLN